MSDEKTHDREKLKPLVKKAKRRVRVKKEQQYHSLNDISLKFSVLKMPF